MSKRTYTLCSIVIAIAIGALVSWSVEVGNAIVPIVAVAGGMGVLYFCRSQVKEIMEDERHQQIAEKASLITFRISMIGMAVGGAVLLALGQSGLVEFRGVGLTLSYTVCVLVLLYLILYEYYSRKY